MLGKYLYVYVVDRDFGFAPNPFFGTCTLATCKPQIRKGACVGDWVMGVGGGRLNATGKCIYLMMVTKKMTFDEYWVHDDFQIKKTCRNGSRLRMVGDNIYHQENGEWVQEDSHHSMPNGTVNRENLNRDTGTTDQVLISDHFYYFGASAINVPLESINYTNIRSHRKIKIDTNVKSFIDKIESDNQTNLNIIVADPFQFDNAHKRVDQSNSRIT